MERETRQGQSPTSAGPNRTGAATSPKDTAAMIEAAEQTPDSPPATDMLTATRHAYIATSEVIGSMPPPATPHGMAGTLVKKLTGKHPNVLLDKLGERLAFERTGIRLYDALLAKAVGNDGAAGPSVRDLEEIQLDEKRHFELVRKHILRLGGDPTAQTPCADVVGVQGIGVLQVVSDPRMTLSQSLNAILTAELADTAGWELLVAVSRQAGEEEMANEFEIAHVAEETHAQKVKGWLAELVRGD